MLPCMFVCCFAVTDFLVLLDFTAVVAATAVIVDFTIALLFTKYVVAAC